MKTTLALFLLIAGWAPGIARAATPDAVQPDSARADTSVTRKDPRWIVVPAPFYMPETSFGVAAVVDHFFRLPGNETSGRTSQVMGTVVYTVKNQMSVSLLPNLYLHDDGLQFIGEVTYSRFPDLFYGIGNDTPETFEEKYTPSTFRFMMDGLFRIRPHVWVGPNILFSVLDLVKTDPDGILAGKSVPGSTGGNTSAAGLVVVVDRRDHENYTMQGQFARLRARWVGTALGSDYTFGLYEADLRQFVRLSADMALGFQVLAAHAEGETPFTLLPRLGGPVIMRGYYEGRHRDHTLLTGQVEYRLRLNKRFGVNVFGAAGEVAPRPGGLAFDRLKWTAGAGLRYALNPSEKMNVRIDYGIGNGTSGFYLTAGEAF